MSEKKTPMCFVCTIVERGSAQKIAKAYEKRGVGLSYRISGEGTASSDLLDILGIGSSERDVLLSPAKREAAESLVQMIHQEGISGVRAKGIMCVIPVTAASMKIAEAVMNAKHIPVKEELRMNNNLKQSMILIAVDQGYTEAVMNTAKAVGARGGTVIRSHILRSENHESFGGPTFAGERELIMIIANQNERNAIMENVDRLHGGDAEAHAILYSVPIEQTAHLS